MLNIQKRKEVVKIRRLRNFQKPKIDEEREYERNKRGIWKLNIMQ